MAANVTYIPPKAAKPEALRVAAYCRVSSDSSDQLHSYATQIKAYTEQIGAHADWELVDVYADEGLTGTRMDKREDFQRLLADCRKGKVDRVLCKSISRFARNTKDCLAALRELSALGVTVYFEKENIDTGTLTSELMGSVSGPGGIHLHLPKPAHELQAENGTGGVYYLQSPLRLPLGGGERIGDHPGRSRAGTMDIRILSFRKKSGVDCGTDGKGWNSNSGQCSILAENIHSLYPDQREVHR